MWVIRAAKAPTNIAQMAQRHSRRFGGIPDYLKLMKNISHDDESKYGWPGPEQKYIASYHIILVPCTVQVPCTVFDTNPI